jgi:hypothetical protein
MSRILTPEELDRLAQVFMIFIQVDQRLKKEKRAKLEQKKLKQLRKKLLGVLLMRRKEKAPYIN